MALRVLGTTGRLSRPERTGAYRRAVASVNRPTCWSARYDRRDGDPAVYRTRRQSERQTWRRELAPIGARRCCQAPAPPPHRLARRENTCSFDGRLLLGQRIWRHVQAVHWSARNSTAVIVLGAATGQRPCGQSGPGRPIFEPQNETAQRATAARKQRDLRPPCVVHPSRQVLGVRGLARRGSPSR